MLLEKLIQTDYDGTSGLYVCVIPTPKSADLLVAIGSALGLEVSREELHVTLMYSITPARKSSVNWADTMASETWRAVVEGIDLFGKNKDHLVVTLDSYPMDQEHAFLTQMGANHSWSEFKPHCTLGKMGAGVDSSMIKRVATLIKGRELFFGQYKWSNLSEDENE